MCWSIFFVSKRVVTTIGVEAQGYVQLAFNFVSYVSIITVALNSVHGRFVTVALTQGDYSLAEKYYNSVFRGLIVLFSALAVPLALVVWNIDKIVTVPLNLLPDVRITFSFAFAYLILTNLLAVWNVVFYAKNVLYLYTISAAIMMLFSGTTVILMFMLLKPRMWYNPFAMSAVIPLTAIWALYCKRRFLPELKFKRHTFSFAALKEILASGIWNSLQSAGEMLLGGLDILFCNIFIDPVAMGVIALAKTLPLQIQSITNQISSTFSPQLTIKYAAGEDCTYEIKRASKIVSIVCTIPVGLMFAYGKQLFEMWIPNQNASQLYILTLPSLFAFALTLGTYPYNLIFLALNRIKEQSISVIVIGVFGSVLLICLLKMTNFGLYAVAIISISLDAIRRLVHMVPKSAKLLGLKWHGLFYGVAYSLICTGVATVVAFGFSFLFFTSSWSGIILAVTATTVISLLLNVLLVFNQDEKHSILQSVQTVLKIKK